MKRNRIITPHVRAAELIHAISWALLALLVGVTIAVALLSITGHLPR